MNLNTSDTSRRIAIQKMLLAISGFSFMPSMLMAENQASTLPPSLTNDGLKPFLVPPSAPLEPGKVGLNIRTLVRSSQTNLQFSSVEFAVAAKKMGPAPHLHKELDELMFVVEGTASVMVEDTVYEIPAGGWHLRPRNMAHTFFNNTNQPFRAIDMYFNQNFEDYLEELYYKIIPDMIAQKATMRDPAIAKRMDALHAKFGITEFPKQRELIIKKYGLW